MELNKTFIDGLWSKEIKAAVMDTLKGQIAYNNDGMRASYRVSNHV